MTRNVPSRAEDQKVCERRSRIPGWGCENTEDRGVDVIHGNGSNIDEFGQVVFVRHIVAVPRYDVER